MNNKYIIIMTLLILGIPLTADAAVPEVNFNLTNYQSRTIQLKGNITFYANNFSEGSCSSHSMNSGIIIVHANPSPVRFSLLIPDAVVACVNKGTAYHFWIDIHSINGLSVKNCSSSFANLTSYSKGYIKIEPSNLMFREDGSCSVY